MESELFSSFLFLVLLLEYNVVFGLPSFDWAPFRPCGLCWWPPLQNEAVNAKTFLYIITIVREFLEGATVRACELSLFDVKGIWIVILKCLGWQFVWKKTVTEGMTTAWRIFILAKTKTMMILIGIFFFLLEDFSKKGGFAKNDVMHNSIGKHYKCKLYAYK